jgi:hypothetical protein
VTDFWLSPALNINARVSPNDVNLFRHAAVSEELNLDQIPQRIKFQCAESVSGKCLNMISKFEWQAEFQYCKYTKIFCSGLLIFSVIFLWYCLKSTMHEG